MPHKSVNSAIAGATRTAPSTPIEVGPAGLSRPVGTYNLNLPTPSLDRVLFVLPGDGTISAARTHDKKGSTLRFDSCPDLDRVIRHMIRLGQADAIALRAAGKPRRGQCRVCGCTLTRACPSGCWWDDETETLCRQHTDAS